MVNNFSKPLFWNCMNSKQVNFSKEILNVEDGEFYNRKDENTGEIFLE